MANVIDQKKLKNEFVVSGQGTLAEWNAELVQVDALEAACKRRIALIRWSALAAFLVLVIPGALGVAGGTLLLVLGISVPIAILIYSVVADGKKIIEDRVSFLRLLLNMLQEDAGDRARFTILLRLRSQREKLSEGPNPRSASGKQILLKDRWLTLSCRMSDGTSISESVVDLIRQSTKKNPRGKIKTKERRICLLRIQLAYRSDVYGDAGVAARRLQDPFRLPIKAALKASSFENAKVSTKTIVKGTIIPGDLRDATQAILLGSYRILNLSRRCVAATGGAK